MYLKFDYRIFIMHSKRHKGQCYLTIYQPLQNYAINLWTTELFHEYVNTALNSIVLCRKSWQ